MVWGGFGGGEGCLPNFWGEIVSNVSTFLYLVCVLLRVDVLVKVLFETGSKKRQEEQESRRAHLHLALREDGRIRAFYDALL